MSEMCCTNRETIYIRGNSAVSFGVYIAELPGLLTQIGGANARD
jgi:hypothetical protein